RWRGRDKRECGIHFDFNASIAKPVSQTSLTLFKEGAFRTDPWKAWTEDDTAEEARYTHVPLAVFRDYRDVFLASPHPIGLRVDPGDRVEDVAEDLGRFASIAINFPAFTDGRGYS